MTRTAHFKLGALIFAVLAIIGVMAFAAFYSPAYTVTTQSWKDTPSANVQLPQFPDVDRYNKVTVEGMMPKALKTFEAGVGSLKDYPTYLPASVKAENKAEDAKAIIVRRGVASIDDVFTAINNPAYIAKYSKGYVVKVPLLVEPDATLVLKEAAQSLILQQESGVFIAVRGNFFALNSAIIGWNMAVNKPASLGNPNLGNPKDFRPFLVFWDGSKSYIAGTRLAHLGYDSPRTYGLSYSMFEDAAAKHEEAQGPSLMWPTGWVVDSVIENLYSGLYAQRAENIAMIGNEFKNNVMHGIALYNQSRNMLIANNEIMGTKNRHGILMSRNVDNNWIFKNKIYEHIEAGILIERNSRDNVVAFNEIYKNKDGVRIYESPQTLLWSNINRENTRNGVRVRNSADVTMRHEIIKDNGLYGLDAYTGRLNDHDDRNLGIDPYVQNTGIDIAYSELDGNKMGQVRFDKVDAVNMAFVTSSAADSTFMVGDFAAESAEFLSLMSNSDAVVLIKNRTEMAKVRQAERAQ